MKKIKLLKLKNPVYNLVDGTDNLVDGTDNLVYTISGALKMDTVRVQMLRASETLKMLTKAETMKVEG